LLRISQKCGFGRDSTCGLRWGVYNFFPDSSLGLDPLRCGDGRKMARKRRRKGMEKRWGGKGKREAGKGRKDRGWKGRKRREGVLSCFALSSKS